MSLPSLSLIEGGLSWLKNHVVHERKGSGLYKDIPKQLKTFFPLAVFLTDAMSLNCFGDQYPISTFVLSGNSTARPSWQSQCLDIPTDPTEGGRRSFRTVFLQSFRC